MKNDFLSHYGISGQKWGVRRYQNEDGTYTEAGKARYYGNLSEKEKRLYDDNYDTLSEKDKQYVDNRVSSGKSFSSSMRSLGAKKTIRYVAGATAAYFLAKNFIKLTTSRSVRWKVKTALKYGATSYPSVRKARDLISKYCGNIRWVV